jgi:hypothetical protein
MNREPWTCLIVTCHLPASLHLSSSAVGSTSSKQREANGKALQNDGARRQVDDFMVASRIVKKQTVSSHQQGVSHVLMTNRRVSE